MSTSILLKVGVRCLFPSPRPRWKLKNTFSSFSFFNHLNISKRFLFTGKENISKWKKKNGNKKLGTFIRWTPIPLSIGFAVAYQQYWQSRSKNSAQPFLVSDWELSCYRLLPLRTVSRVWGWINNVNLPVWTREPILNLYARTFGCNIEEAEDVNLINYKNLGEFFRRGLKPDARTIHPGDCIVSPADGVVMTCGRVKKSRLEQVKGVTYTLDSFLGLNTWKSDLLSNDEDSNSYHKSLLSDPVNNELYHYVVYLAPGDYHRFHSPVDWEISFRRHFTGDLLSVGPGIARWVPGLFTLNERAVYVGRWKGGFFAFAAVGATNVGSIRICIDKALQTNCKKNKKGSHHDFNFAASIDGVARVCKGELFGEFNLGSTIVLVFEAPRDFKFSVSDGERIKVGQVLNACYEKEHAKEKVKYINNEMSTGR